MAQFDETRLKELECGTEYGLCKVKLYSLKSLPLSRCSVPRLIMQYKKSLAADPQSSP